MRARWVIGNTIFVQIRETAGAGHRPVLKARQQNARRLLGAEAGRAVCKPRIYWMFPAPPSLLITKPANSSTVIFWPLNST